VSFRACESFAISEIHEESPCAACCAIVNPAMIVVWMTGPALLVLQPAFLHLAGHDFLRERSISSIRAYPRSLPSEASPTKRAMSNRMENPVK
jgi:hypothetical protein